LHHVAESTEALHVSLLVTVREAHRLDRLACDVACEAESGNGGRLRALSCAMNLFTDFGFQSCALTTLTFFICALEMGTCGEATLHSSVRVLSDDVGAKDQD
jgi:hypothetical protein